MRNTFIQADRYKTDSKSYRALMQMLRRQSTKDEPNIKKSKSPGILASFYLDCFVMRTKKIFSDSVIELGLCEKGKFTDWRAEQRKYGNLQWETVNLGNGKIVYEYQPGPKLLKHLSSISNENFLFVTKGDLADALVPVNKDVDTLREEVGSLKSKVEQMNCSMQSMHDLIKLLIAKHDDPYTEEKFDRYMSSPEKLIPLIQ